MYVGQVHVRGSVSHKTHVLVDAYAFPWIRCVLRGFERWYGLPYALCSNRPRSWSTTHSLVTWTCTSIQVLPFQLFFTFSQRIVFLAESCEVLDFR